MKFQKSFYLDGLYGLDSFSTGYRILVRVNQELKINVSFFPSTSETFLAIRAAIAEVEEASWRTLESNPLTAEIGFTKAECAWVYQTIIPLD